MGRLECSEVGLFLRVDGRDLGLDSVDCVGEADGVTLGEIRREGEARF